MTRDERLRFLERTFGGYLKRSPRERYFVIFQAGANEAMFVQFTANVNSERTPGGVRSRFDEDHLTGEVGTMDPSLLRASASEDLARLGFRDQSGPVRRRDDLDLEPPSLATLTEQVFFAAYDLPADFEMTGEIGSFVGEGDRLSMLRSLPVSPFQGVIGDLRERAGIKETDSDTPDDVYSHSSRPLLLGEAEASARAASEALNAGENEVAERKRAVADRLFRLAVEERAETESWSSEQTALAFVRFLIEWDKPEQALEILRPWVTTQILSRAPGSAWNQALMIHTQQRPDAQAALELLEEMHPAVLAIPPHITIGQLASHIAQDAEWRERRAAERDPSVAGRYAEPVLVGLVRWAEMSGDRETCWSLRAQLGRFDERVGRLQEARLIYERVVSEGGVGQPLTIDRLSLMMERAHEYTAAVELIEGALTAGMTGPGPPDEIIANRLRRCLAKVNGTVPARNAPIGMRFVTGQDAVEIVHMIAFKRVTVHAGYVIDGRLWLRGEDKDGPWAAAVDHRGDGAWEEVDPGGAPDPVIATRPDGYAVREQGSAAGRSPVLAFRSPALAFGMLTVHRPDGSVSGSLPSGFEVVAGVGGWCVREADGTLRVHDRNGGLRWSRPVAPRFDPTRWRGDRRSVAAGETVVVCTEPTGMTAFDESGSIVWHAAPDTPAADIIVAGTGVGVTGGHYDSTANLGVGDLSWYDIASGERRIHEDITPTSGEFVRDVDGLPAAVKGSTRHQVDHPTIVAALLQPDGRRPEVRAPFNCRDWWGWRGGLIAQGSVDLLITDSTGQVRLQATLPRRLNMVVRDAGLLVCVLNPLTVLRPRWAP